MSGENFLDGGPVNPNRPAGPQGGGFEAPEEEVEEMEAPQKPPANSGQHKHNQ